MHLFVSVCMFVCMSLWTYVCTYERVHRWIDVPVSICILFYLSICLDVHMLLLLSSNRFFILISKYVQLAPTSLSSIYFTLVISLQSSLMLILPQHMFGMAKESSLLRSLDIKVRLENPHHLLCFACPSIPSLDFCL